MWTARRILKEICEPDTRRSILTHFWRHGDPNSRAMAAAQLARAMRFRDETIKKMPADKKADLLASRIGVPDFEQFFEMALMVHLTHDKTKMLAAFLDRWGIPHENGSIENDEYKTPTVDEVRDAATALQEEFGREDVLTYLAAAGLLMDENWRNVTWPVVDELTAAS